MDFKNTCLNHLNGCYLLENVSQSFYSFYSCHAFFFQEYQEYLQMEKQLLEELGVREESDDLEET